MTDTTYRFLNSCVSWESNDVDEEGGLIDLIDSRLIISRETFLKYVDRDELKDMEKSLGYSTHPKQGLTMAGDFHVEYFRSVHHDERVYGFRHSAIEYVFKA